MKILLTGHKGFLGSHLLEALKEEHEVHGFDCRTYQEFDSTFQEVRHRSGKHDIVLHCGAVSNSEDTSNRLWQLNYQASCDIADYCEATNTKLIFFSSAAAIHPQTPYGWSKLCAEFYLQQKVAGMNLCILRPYNIWGFDEQNKANPSIVYKILTGTLPFIYKGCTRDFIHVSDVVSAVQQVLNDSTQGCFSLGTAEPTNIQTLLDLLYQDTGSYPKPPVVSKAAIAETLVAKKEELLPNSKPTSLSKYIKQMQAVVQKEGGES